MMHEWGRGYNGVGAYFGEHAGYMHSGLGMLIMGIFTIAVFIVGIYLIKKFGHRNSSNAALEELKIRFAKGEMEEDEFTRRKNILKDK